MEIGLGGVAGRILDSMLEEASGDIVIHLDKRGFVQPTSGNLAKLGIDLGAALLPPHITDLADHDYAAFLASEVSGVLAGRPMSGWVEFPVLTCAGDHDTSLHGMACRRWYALRLRPVLAGDGAVDDAVEGAVGLLRSVHQLRSLEGELHARSVTDPITGLANRQAFCASLRRHLAAGGGQMMAVLGVDGMRALLLRYGHRTADEVVWGFAKFLETMALPGYELAQLDAERFAVILPAANEAEARGWCSDALATFAGLASPVSPKGPALSASAGLARIECTVDWTLREAELGLVLARASGGGQVMRGMVARSGFAAAYGHGAGAR
ncbi:MAG: GGDEF domain-containing protein [Erythrobacter sp.]